MPRAWQRWRGRGRSQPGRGPSRAPAADRASPPGAPTDRPAGGEHPPLVQYASCLIFVCFCPLSPFVGVLKGSPPPPPACSFQIRIRLGLFFFFLA